MEKVKGDCVFAYSHTTSSSGQPMKLSDSMFKTYKKE